jgi:uncharacterized membrane protein YhaH (DUF805 family)
MSAAALGAMVLVCALILAVSERLRHDLVAIVALFACVVLGLISPDQALTFRRSGGHRRRGILVLGRAIEAFGDWPPEQYAGQTPQRHGRHDHGGQ